MDVDMICIAIIGLGAIIVSIMLCVEGMSNASKKYDAESWKHMNPAWDKDDDACYFGGC